MVTEEDLIRTVTAAYASGWRQVKLYFMCGLPTEEDEDEFSDDGGFDGKPHFEWGDEPEDEDLFEGDDWKPNQKLVEANERYKSEVKKMNTKKNKSK
jgi:hypothetical protein